MNSVDQSKKKPLVAILDDDKEYAELVGCMFEEQGYDFVVFGDKSKFLDSIGSRPPDLIVTDIVAPNMNGFEFLERIKSDARLSSIPVIIVSGMRGVENTSEQAAEVGAFAWIRKPFEFEELSDVAKRAFKTK